MSFEPASKEDGDVADLVSWGIADRRSLVAGMASKDDAAERGCFRPGTSATRRTSDDK